jgi:hypothetical protein
VNEDYPTHHDAYNEAMRYEYVTLVEPLVKSDAIDLRIMKNAAKKTESGEGFSRKYFADLLSAIMVTLKVAINDEISTRLFCSLVLRYKDYVEQQNRMNESNN